MHLEPSTAQIFIEGYKHILSMVHSLEGLARSGSPAERLVAARQRLAGEPELLDQALEALEVNFQAILASPLLRARQTAQIVARTLRATARLRNCEALAPGVSAQKLFAELKRLGQPENVLVVGHEPDMSRLISLLLAGEPPVDVEMKKAALCCLELREPVAARCATLKWLVPPKLLNL